MEIQAQSVSHPKLPKSPSPSGFHFRASFFAYTALPNTSTRTTIPKQLQCLKITSTRPKKLGVVYAASEAQSPPSDVTTTDRWLLEPVGDGDYKHIGFKVALPDAFEIESDELTVGRVPGKADMVIPVATVSAQHALIQKKEGNLVVTDLNSTNGTFINESRLAPGVASVALPGSCVTFGDINLAIFRVSKLKTNVEAPSNADGSSSSEPDSDSKSDEST